MAKIYLVHVKAWNGSSEVTLYFSSAVYITGSSNLPPDGVANIGYKSRITQPAMIQQDCWGTGKIGGASRIGFGTIELANTDGGLDYLTTYAFDNRSIKVIVGEVQPNGTPVWTTVLTGKMSPPVIGMNKMTLYLRDRMVELDKPVCVNTYAGNNSLPNGLEGTADDIGGSRKPRIFGKVLNIEPVCVNTSLLIYQVNDGAINDIPKAYDQGAQLTKGANYTDQTDMETNAPAAGNYRILPAMGLFRIGSALVGTLTCDVTEGSASGDRTGAQLAYDVGIIGGLVSGDFSSSDITALDTANSAQLGVYYRDETTCIEAIDYILDSIGAWWGFDRLGILRMKQWAAPSGSPVITLTSSKIKDIERISDENSIPTWRLVLKYRKNYTVQTQDIAAGVTSDRRAVIGADSLSYIRAESSVKTANLGAIEQVKETAITGASNGLTEAGAESLRLINIYKIQRQRYDVTVFIDATLLSTISLGDVVRLQISRFGMTSGVDLRILGIKTDMNTNKVFLSLWG
jgi:hypothetical protein